MAVARKKATKKSAAKRKPAARKKVVAKKKAAPKKKATAKKKAAPKRKTVAKKKAAPARKTAAKKKAAPKKSTARKAAPKKKAAKRKPNAAFMRPMTVSDALSEVVGTKPIPRTEVTKKLWAYIKKNKLQDSVNRRMIVADDKLKKVFGGKKKVNMFEMTKLVSKHLS